MAKHKIIAATVPGGILYKGEYLNVKSGDVILFRNEFILSRPATWLSAIVRYFTKCYYNHCGVIVSNWDVPFVNESIFRGTVPRQLSTHIERLKTKIIILRPKQMVEERDFCRRANSILTIAYAYRTLVWEQLIYRTLGIWIGRTEEQAERDGMVCSEYVAWCHSLPKWWLYSSGELLNSDHFQAVFIE